jgi:HAD superfamily hydrolase (TIGR01509 family)
MRAMGAPPRSCAAHGLLGVVDDVVGVEHGGRLQLPIGADATDDGGAEQLAQLERLTELGVRWAIATSGYGESARPIVRLLDVPDGVPVVTRDQVSRAKPDPDLFLAAADRLGVAITDSLVVGDSVWDLLAARRARALGVGVLSGGYGREELERAGAYRVYEDPADLLGHLDEVGVRSPP